MAGIARLHEQAQDRALAVHGAPHLTLSLRSSRAVVRSASPSRKSLAR